MIYTDGIRLMSDKNDKELHAFAERLGMNRSLFVRTPLSSHYNITERWHLKQALNSGAQMITDYELTLKCSRVFRGK